ncbi:S9 family peptidase [Aureivirga sp. CE67]|uniref:S9 family peptidase n=1 Tax=Aureivirga sp. CE67 TaxID=1788983 RepID=UPI0018C96AE1|nr:S9 family peptidase [Aureivirga sp. CE67]
MNYKNIKIPFAEKKIKKLEKHGDVRIDNYYWLNQREDKEVISYIESENKYYDSVMDSTKNFQEEVFEEMKARIKEEDSSVPYKKRGYYYINKYIKGAQYPIYTRKKETLEADEEVILDVNDMAKGFEYYKVSGLTVSSNNKLAAYGIDSVSRREYTLQFKNLETGEIYADKIEKTQGDPTWANDNKTIFYTKQDPQTLRSDRVFMHVLGTDASEDKEVFFEQDEAFSCYVYKTKSEKYIVIGSYSTLSTEYRVLEADNPSGEFKVIQERMDDLEYSIAHYDSHFYILTNKDNSINFKIVKTPENATTVENWVDVIPHDENILIEDFSIFKDYLVIEDRFEGLNRVRIKRWDETEDYFLPFGEETYAAGVYGNSEFNTDIIRYTYNSLSTPNSVIDFNMKTREKKIKKEQEVLDKNFDKDNYKSERLWATGDDGEKIAISVVYRKDTPLNSETPLLLYAYGSYGHTIDPSFSTTRLSLLDRGFVFAIAHIRGGEYLGRKWYENGKLLTKKNTFTDFTSCAKFLIEKNYTSARHLYAQGGSAGGMLMGVILNTNPELFNGVLAEVPFVDVVTTMLDDTIPLTTGEYDEWGNPNEKKYYDYMKSYSPYDNVVNQKYPNILVTTGFHDSQVQYFEPAKWVAKLRDFKTDNNLLLFHTNMDTGHSGSSGRFDSLKEVARDFVFLLELEKSSSN